jgi:two-component system, response regulator YesN
MRFNLLIVDDEPIIGRGLSLTIPWEVHDIEIAAVAHDGEDAIDKIRSHGNIDIVMTDVRMPKVDGIQLAAHLSQHYPHIKIIMISGYDEFKYAQKALQLGVQDYLLKPVDVDELLNVVSKITHALEVEHTTSQQVRAAKLENAIFHQVFDFPHNLSMEEDINQTSIYAFLSMRRDYMVTTNQMSPDELEKMNSDWQSMVYSRLKSKGLESFSLFTNKNILLTCVINNQKVSSFQKEIVSILREWSTSFTFVLHHSEVLIQNFNQTYLQLCGQIKYLPFHPNGFYIVPFQESSYREEPSMTNEIEISLINAIFTESEGETYKLTSQLFDEFEEGQFFLENVVQSCKSILSNILKRFESLFRKYPSASRLSFTHNVDVHLYNSFGQLKKLFERDIEKVREQFDHKNIESNDWLIERAESYIKSYYTSNIKAHEVADYINISPNYFSTLFKQKTEKSFNEYINELRIDNAKILLHETPFKVNEIAEKVGYQEYKYFVEIFRKLSGMTPTQYRKLVSSKRSGILEEEYK